MRQARSGETSLANRDSAAPSSYRNAAMKIGKSGVGVEVPPLRSANQYGYNSVVMRHVNTANSIQHWHTTQAHPAAWPAFPCFHLAQQTAGGAAVPHRSGGSTVPSPSHQRLVEA